MTDDVKTVIHSLLPDPNLRRLCLEILVETIDYTNFFGSEKWGMYYKHNKIRLVVGNLIVFTIEKGRIWLALDRELLEKSLKLKNYLRSNKISYLKTTESVIA